MKLYPGSKTWYCYLFVCLVILGTVGNIFAKTIPLVLQISSYLLKNTYLIQQTMLPFWSEKHNLYFRYILAH